MIVVLSVASANAKIGDYVLSILPIPLAERGYYVFHVALVRRVLLDEGLGDTPDPLQVAASFGADAVLYVSIVRWDTVYGRTTDTVELSYVLKCGKTGAVLWTDGEQRTHEWSEQSTGLIEQLLNAIVDPLLAPLVADHERLAREANDAVLASRDRGLRRDRIGSRGRLRRNQRRRRAPDRRDSGGVTRQVDPRGRLRVVSLATKNRTPGLSPTPAFQILPTIEGL